MTKEPGSTKVYILSAYAQVKKVMRQKGTARKEDSSFGVSCVDGLLVNRK